ncbi:division/cell wall cluster transcriptional repressor MraZ [Tropicimonas sp. IMCC34011]|uniref:division/cell wall cluster transcriptional repressor MraZ n=1 Tax=Tropicimonas sp. IMCC34011 TaxID=2248759 RepID=UPI0013004878|nr:cell division/cell wall cluster transcriptional repressor MraZ [Tropicimonas sp. IMCC34011]
MLLAQDSSAVDGKNPELTVVYGHPAQKYLECHSAEGIQEVDRRISAMPMGSETRRKVERIYYGLSAKVRLDDNGRLVLNPRMRAKLGDTTDVYMTGAGATFQIWNPAVFERLRGPIFDAPIDEDDDTDFDPQSLFFDPDGGV